MVEQVSSLKTGEKYKDTPIGKFPVDWEIKKLIDVAGRDKYSFTGGPFGSNLKENCYTDHGVRIIQLQNIGDGEFFDDYKIFTSEEKADELKSCNIYPGDIMIAKMADPVARACIIPDTDDRYLMASDGIRLSVNEREHDVKFIFYAINSKYFRKNAERHGTGSTRLRIGLTVLKNLPIGIPSLKEQKRTAEILSVVDEAIEKTTQTIEKVKELKKGLMQKLFAEGVGHAGFKDTKIGTIPKEWRVVQLSDILDGTGIQILKIGDVFQKDYYLGEEAKRITLLEKELISNEVFEKDILIAIASVKQEGIGKVMYVSKLNERTAFDHNVANLRTDSNKCDQKFLFFTLKSRIVRKQIERLFTTVGTTFLKASEIDKLLIPLPPLDEQHNIVEIFFEIDTNIEKESNHLEQLKLLKKGLMQVLLTGKLRVTV